MRNRREYILDIITDTISDFLYYDRKEDDILPRGAIQEAIQVGEITVEEIVERFEEELRNGLK